MRRWAQLLRWLVDAAPSARDFLEPFFLLVYTRRAHNAGIVDQIIEECSASPDNTQRTSTPSSTTTPATGWRRSPSRRSCSPAGST
jgi:hypothetical protein